MSKPEPTQGGVGDKAQEPFKSKTLSKVNTVDEVIE